MARALWVQTATGTGLRFKDITHLIPQQSRPSKSALASDVVTFELAASAGGASPVPVITGLSTMAEAEVARDGLMFQDDEEPGKLTYTDGRWNRQEITA